MIRANVLFLLVVFAIGGVGCGGAPTIIPTSSSSAPSQVWILHPEEGDHVTVNHSVTIQLQGASFFGIDRFQVKVPEAGVEWKAFPQSTGSGGAEYGTMFFAETSWTPNATGDFAIVVRAINAYGTSPWDVVHVTVVEPVVKVTHTPSPTPVLGSHAGLELKATLTPTWVADQPQATAKQNANCRYGPGTAYDIADTLFAGKTAPIVGRNEQSTWWQVRGPTFGSLCWVSKVTVDVSGSTEGVPIGVAPAPPTLTREPHKPQNQPKQGCYVYDASGAQVCTVPCPANAQPGGACTP